MLAHHISLINVQAGVALHLIDEQPERARPALAEIKEASREALRELRGRARHPAPRRGRAPRARRPRLADLDRARGRGRGRRARRPASTSEPLPAGLPAAVELAAYRIVQEALTNVVAPRPGHARRRCGCATTSGR